MLLHVGERKVPERHTIAQSRGDAAAYSPELGSVSGADAAEQLRHGTGVLQVAMEPPRDRG
jgi:hypothetical protein